MNAKLFRNDRGVRVLVFDGAQGFFKEDVLFNGLIDNRITLVSILEGDEKALIIATKPDVVVVNGSIEGSNVVKVNYLDVTGNIIVELNTLTELNGHVFYAIKSNGEECTYSQFLIIDQLKSLKAKLNID